MRKAATTIQRTSHKVFPIIFISYPHGYLSIPQLCYNAFMTALKGTTSLEKSKIIKKEAAEEAEKLQVLGQESDTKAKPYIVESVKNQLKQEQKDVDDAMEKLADAKGRKLTYKEALLTEMRREMENWIEDLPQGFTWYPKGTDKGIELWLRNNQNQWYAKGLILSGTPEIDLNGVARLIVSAIKESKDQVKPKTSQGIILPYK